MTILTLNVGSSSLKAQLFGLDDVADADAVLPPEPLWHGEVALRVDGAELPAKIHSLLSCIAVRSVDAVAHRVVRSSLPVTQNVRLIDDDVLAAIDHATELAPEHNPMTVATIIAAREVWPNARQFALFDSAFHRTIAETAAIYAGPYEWFAEGIHKIGFHGLSHAYCAERAAQLLGPKATKLVIAHIGSGASLAAISDGRSVDTTMGFTTLDGLIMATRSGSIDPGLVLYLLRKGRYSAVELERVLSEDSGLRGISGRQSGDMQGIITAMDGGDPRAALAFGAFVYRLSGSIGAMSAACEGIDALIFTAGIGEKSARVRNETCRSLRYLGIAIDEQRNVNVTEDSDISSLNAQTRTLVIHTQEGWQMARTIHRSNI